MRINLLISCLLTFCSISGFAQQKEANYQVIPLPQQIDLQEGQPFVLNRQTKILVPAQNAVLKSDAAFLANYIKEATGRTIPVIVINKKSPKKNVIILGLDKTISHKEGYTLKVNTQQINIKGNDVNGVFYGIQTIRKSIPAVATNCDINMPAVTITDYPRFSYRGMHLDCGRHFFPAKFIKEYIDLIALHNMNTFHWHLTEDQGWRIEIKKYPKLTQIGSQRKETVIGHNSGKFDGQPYGGYYTQAEIKDIVAYAKARHITIIPEIDMPGHMLGALASYPELGCTGGPYEVATQWGVFPDVLCIGKEKTFKFIEDVLDEVIALFPSKYIHIGGDEAPRVRWKTCPLCQKRIKDEGIKADAKHTAEDRLQSYFMSRIEKHLNSKGRQIIGWDEILEGDVAPNATVMSWRGTQGGIEAAKLHHNVIMTPNTYVYFDYYQSEDIKNEPLAIGGFLPVEKVYSFEPTAGIGDSEKQYIIGAQANVWSEYIPTTKQVEYMSVPRMAALAEVQWTEPQKKDYKNFLARLPRLIDFYQRDGLNYAKHILDVADSFKLNADKKQIHVGLTTADNAPIYYTLDGSEPTASSPQYNGGIDISKTCQLKAVAIRQAEKTRTLSREFFFNKATLCPITVKELPKGKYAYNGATTLNDGMRGGSGWDSGRWLGFFNQILEATIDFGSFQQISRFSTEANIDMPSYIMGPSNISIYVSDDNKTFTEICSKDYSENEINRKEIAPYNLTFTPVTTKYVKVVIKPFKVLPKGHGGAGTPPYLFIDELSFE